MGLFVTEELPNEMLTPVGDQEAYAAIVVLAEPAPDLGNTGIDRLLRFPRAEAGLTELPDVGWFVLTEDRPLRFLIGSKPVGRLVNVGLRPVELVDNE